MPEYLSMEMTFIQKRITPDFIKDTYRQIINAGFGFMGGYRWKNGKRLLIKTTLDEISEWNQARLEERIRLDFPKTEYDDTDGYRQILFKREGYSEIRGYLMEYNQFITFELIVPHDDVLFYNNGVYYKKDKIEPFIKLAQALWENGKVDAIQTELEYDDPTYKFSDMVNGENIRYRPFAVLPEVLYKKFPTDYFGKARTVKLSGNGVYIEQTDRIVIK